MATNGFNADFELSLGSVVGVRAFKFDYLDRLVGVSHDDKVFIPGVNQAECWICNLEELATCDCGFYAYFRGQDNQYMRGNPVGAIIEGTGKTVIGSKGFRTEKAELLALFPLSRRKTVNWRVRITRWLYPSQRWFKRAYDEDIEAPVFAISTILAVVLGAVGIASLFSSDWETGTWMLPVAAWLGGLGRRCSALAGGPDISHLVRTRKEARREDPFPKLSKLYPDVPVYQSQREALRKHPLTTAEEHIPVPVIPTPETVDGFWDLPTTPRKEITSYNGR